MTAPNTAMTQQVYVSPGKRHAESEVKIAGEQMKRIEKDDNYRMPESVFVSVFLNYFHSGKIDERYLPDNCENGLDAWIALTGNLYREVDVHDRNGAVLFTVPPLMNRHAVKSQFNSQHGIMRDINNAELYSAYSENHSTRHLEQALDRRQMINQDNTLLHKFAERWNSIYTRYGLEKIAARTLGEPAAATETKKQEVETNYDEWDPA